MSAITINKGKPLKGTAPLHGDFLLSLHALLITSLTPQKITVDNISTSPAFRELCNLFIQAGVPLSLTDNSLKRDEGPLTWQDINDPIPVINEVVLFALGGFFSGQGKKVTFIIDTTHISIRVVNLFARQFQCSADSDIDKHSSGPITLSPSVLRNTNSNDYYEDYLLKTGLLYYHFAAGNAISHTWKMGGADYPERLLSSLDPAVVIQNLGKENLSEFEKRLARKSKKQEKPKQTISLPPSLNIPSFSLSLPNDVSLAAVYALAATLIPGSEIVLENIAFNATRTAFFNALRRMGAEIETLRKREKQGEVYGDLKVSYSELKGRKFDKESLKGMRDELPLLIIAGACASDETVIRDIDILRDHPQDMLKHMIISLKQANVEIGEVEDGLVIRGASEYDGQTYLSLGNPMLGFSWMTIGLFSHGQSLLEESECMTQRFPEATDYLVKSGNGTYC
ncbi:MAG: hypothetical protein HQK83_03935 [Fibrobacteria bacterium]|nr:hypothetical protein [Fibrobacteria bacterium]